MKKLLALFLALIMLLSALPLAGAAFKDEGFIAEEYRKSVAVMSEKGIINGFADGSFGPKKTLTRAQAAKIICVMLEGEEKANALTKTETGFADVPATHWAAKFVAYCVEKGIVSGVGNGKFDPDGKLSSAAFAKMLLVAYGKGNDGFTGADWQKNVQTVADSTIYMYNIGDKLTTGALERQKAAQLARNALVQKGAEEDFAKGDTREYKPSVPETMKIYMIGNSYGNDCTIKYLYEMLKDLGVKDLAIGILYYSGCRYHQHADFLLQDKPVYKFYKNSTGKFKTHKNMTFDQTLNDEKWTHILTQGGGTTIADLDDGGIWKDVVFAHVREAHPDAPLFYAMPWSYRTDGQHSETHLKRMKEYGDDSMKMYEGIKTTKDNLIGNDTRFKGVIPAGTAILNARSSFIGNGIHRDKISHLNKGVGRYIAAMATCCTLTGVTPDQINYVPTDLLKDTPAGLNKEAPGLQEALVKVARESVTNMLAKPYEVTQSQYKTAP